MQKIKLFLALGIVTTVSLLLNTSCENNNKEVLYGCDSLNVSYSKTIQPLLSANCYKCHSSANASSLGGGTVLDSHTDLITWIDITPGSDGGILLQDIKHLGNPMPKSASKLSSCDIAKIEHWIFEGGKNN